MVVHGIPVVLCMLEVIVRIVRETSMNMEPMVATVEVRPTGKALLSEIRHLGYSLLCLGC